MLCMQIEAGAMITYKAQLVVQMHTAAAKLLIGSQHSEHRRMAQLSINAAESKWLMVLV